MAQLSAANMPAGFVDKIQGHAQQPRYAADGHVGQDLGLPGIDRSVEDQRDADPVTAQ